MVKLSLFFLFVPGLIVIVSLISKIFIISLWISLISLIFIVLLSVKKKDRLITFLIISSFVLRYYLLASWYGIITKISLSLVGGLFSLVIIPMLFFSAFNDWKEKDLSWMWKLMLVLPIEVYGLSLFLEAGTTFNPYISVGICIMALLVYFVSLFIIMSKVKKIKIKSIFFGSLFLLMLIMGIIVVYISMNI